MVPPRQGQTPSAVPCERAARRDALHGFTKCIASGVGKGREENFLCWKDFEQLGVCLAVKSLGCSTGANKILVPALLLLFKEMERDREGGR